VGVRGGTPGISWKLLKEGLENDDLIELKIGQCHGAS